MNKCFSLFFLIVFCACLYGQTVNTWFVFYNGNKTKIGFKDKNGNVKIHPKFNSLTIANKFDDIIVVAEASKNESVYYLTKTGRKIGRDSIYMFDNTPDCENEGFIRFNDRKTDKVGVFNKNGKIVIPPEYNWVTRVMNGMLVALKGAEKKYYPGGEHYKLEGGVQLLIDTNNKVLIENFKYENLINFYSLKISNQPIIDSVKQNFKSMDNKYYSFINYEKEFKYWFIENLLDSLNKTDILKATYKEVYFWKENVGWVSESKKTFMDRNFEQIKSKFIEIKSNKYNYNLFFDGLNQFIPESKNFNKYYNNCGESKDWMYPVINVVIDHKNSDGDLLQDSFEFLRTENGYKLLGISIRNGKVK